MPATRYEPGLHSPLRPEEAGTVAELLAALATGPGGDALAAAIVEQAGSLELFGALVARYPSPLQEQTLGDRRRSLETLVRALCSSERSMLLLRTPTQAVVGRALNVVLINFFRLLWHVCAEVPDQAVATRLRERTAQQLRAAIYTRLVEEVLSDLATAQELPLPLRERAVHQLALLWGHRLTWRVSEFFPVLEATWEARSRVRVTGGTLVGASELFQLLLQGADPRFVELLAGREHGEPEAQAFREFLFGRSSEELTQLTERMERERLSSIELDSRLGEDARDAGSIFYEFFQARFQQSHARRLLATPGPRRTAEGYVVQAWLERLPA